MNDTTFNTFFSSISNLEIVETSVVSNFFEKIIGEKNALYYLMAERSIKDAVDSKVSDDYFGLLDINDEKVKVDDTILKSENVKYILSRDFLPSKKLKNSDIEKRYFLTFGTDTGDNLFEVLHDFKTEMFDGENKYKNDISTDSKQAIINIINKNLNIDKSITEKLAAYLVILEAHMSLVTKKPFFVIENNTKLFEEKCFGEGKDFNTFSNKNAFVEIKKEHYDDIKKFLYRLKELNKSDFNIETENKEDENK